MQAETDQSKISCEVEELKPPVDTPGDVAESDPERADPFVLPPDSQPSANADNLDNTDDTGYVRIFFSIKFIMIFLVQISDC